MQIRIEAEALKKEKDDASKDRLKRREAEIKELQAKSDEISAAWKAEKDRLAGATIGQGAARPRPRRTRRRRAPRRLRARRRDQVRRDSCARKTDRRGRRQGRRRRRQERQGAAGEGGGRRRRHRRRRLALDRHPRRQDDGRRAREAAPHGGLAPQARRRPGRGAGDRLQRRAARPRRPAGSEPADRQLHLRRPHRRRARPNSPRRSPNSCSTTNTPCFASTCRSTWKSTPSAA